MALPRGRPWLVLREWLMEAGIPGAAQVDPDAQLLWETEHVRLLFSRPADVVTYVRQGVADMGVTGKDVLLEDGDGVYELLELPGGRWRLSLAVPQGSPPWQEMVARRGSRLRVATSYPTATTTFFEGMGVRPQILKLRGAVELAPAVGLADCIVDMVETGGTLRAHGLVEAEVITPISLRVISNQAAYRWRSAALCRVLQAFTRVREGEAGRA